MKKQPKSEIKRSNRLHCEQKKSQKKVPEVDLLHKK